MSTKFNKNLGLMNNFQQNAKKKTPRFVKINNKKRGVLVIQSIELKLTRIKLIVFAFLSDEVIVVAALNDFAVFKHHNGI